MRRITHLHGSAHFTIPLKYIRLLDFKLLMYITKKKRNKQKKNNKATFFYVNFIMINRKFCPFRLLVFKVSSHIWELKTKTKKKKKTRTHSCVRREVILVRSNWEQSSTALKQRQYRCSI